MSEYILIEIELHSDVFGIIYLILFMLILVNFVYLIFSDPGFIHTQSKELVDIVEKEELNIAEFCPSCKV